jgi:NAD(P)-dependent dehydrogenase (short-subunit alcohol dehydrogenase family)
MEHRAGAEERRTEDERDREQSGESSHYILRMIEGRVASYSGAYAGATEPPAQPLRHRVCVVTGANRGIGLATARGLARLGATVAMVCRDATLGAAAVERVREETGSRDVALIVGDLASRDAIRRAAVEIARRWTAVHILVHNAGVSVSRRTMTSDGVELTLAVNHLGPFLLTDLLLPLLRAGAPSWVVTVTSEFERFGRIDFDDLQLARRYGQTRAYVRTKLANVLFTRALAERVRDQGIVASCVYPGLVATDLLRERWWWRARWLRPLWRQLFRSPEDAAEGIVALVSTPPSLEQSGQCYKDGLPVPTSRRSNDAAAQRRLWEESERLVRR